MDATMPSKANNRRKPLAQCLVLAVLLVLGSAPQPAQAREALPIVISIVSFVSLAIQSGRKLQNPAVKPQHVVTYRGVRVGAAVLTKVGGCPGVTLRDVASIVSRSVVKGRIGAVKNPPTPEARRFSNSVITMYVAPKQIDAAARLKSVLTPIAMQLSVLPYCPFAGDYVLDLQMTIQSIKPTGKRTLTAKDRKVLACVPCLQVTVRSGHIGTFATAAAARAGTLVVPYVLSPANKP